MPVSFTHPTIPATTVSISPNLGAYRVTKNLRTAIASRNLAGVENLAARAGARWRKWDIEAVVTSTQLSTLDSLIDTQDDAIAGGANFEVQFVDIVGVSYGVKLEPADGHGDIIGGIGGDLRYQCSLVVTELLG